MSKVPANNLNLPKYLASSFTYYSKSGHTSLHAHGREGSVALLNWLQASVSDRILELGCGSGNTLVKLASESSCELYGLEANKKMFEVCQKRLDYCGLGEIKLTNSDFTSPLPFSDDFFDKVYCESVLGFQSRTDLMLCLTEVNRVLKPGGLFVANETFWLENSSDDVIRDWNRKCLDSFGIEQANAVLKGGASLKPLYEESGFDPAKYRFERLSSVEINNEGSVTELEKRSIRYSKKQRMLAKLNPILRRQEKSMNRVSAQLNHSKQLMAGFLIACSTKS